jgi:PAS domain S-box-containing protein
MTQANKSVFLREKYFTDIYNNIPVAEALFDLDGNLTDMNDTFKDTFGLAEKESGIGKNIFKDVNFPENFKEMIFSNKKNSFHLKYSFLKADNLSSCRKDVADMDFRTVLLYDSSGKNDAFLLIAIEETEHLRDLERISHFQEIFSMVNSFARIGYAKINRFDKTGIANKEWYENLGEIPYTPINEILCVFAHVHPDDRPKIMDYCQGIAVGTCKGYKLDYRVEVAGCPGKWRWIQAIVKVTYYHPEEGAINAFWANFDITDFKEVEEELRAAREKAEMADQLKSAFLANISHEIRTPLNAIVGFSELMKTSEDAKEKEQYSQIIAQNNELLLRLIGDVLDLSKIESGMMDFKDEPFDICSVLDEIYLTMRQRNANADVEFIKNSPCCHCFVKLDKNRFKQVWWNFITNSSKYTVKGHITIGFECEENGIRIYVEDTGIGVLDFALSGLGLSISKQLWIWYMAR